MENVYRILHVCLSNNKSAQMLLRPPLLSISDRWTETILSLMRENGYSQTISLWGNFYSDNTLTCNCDIAIVFIYLLISSIEIKEWQRQQDIYIFKWQDKLQAKVGVRNLFFQAFVKRKFTFQNLLKNDFLNVDLCTFQTIFVFSKKFISFSFKT